VRNTADGRAFFRYAFAHSRIVRSHIGWAELRFRPGGGCCNLVRIVGRIIWSDAIVNQEKSIEDNDRMGPPQGKALPGLLSRIRPEGQ
jgi:hypothetical protein